MAYFPSGAPTAVAPDGPGARGRAPLALGCMLASRVPPVNGGSLDGR